MLRPAEAAGNAKAQLVRGRECLLVEAYGCVENTGMIGGVDLERREVGRDTAPGIECQEVGRNGDGEGRSFFGVCGRTQFVEENEGVGSSFAGDAIEVHDVS